MTSFLGVPIRYHGESRGNLYLANKNGADEFSEDDQTAIEVLAEPSRRLILDALRTGEQAVQALVEKLALSQPAVSKHLRVLRDAGLVVVRPDGQRRLYRLRIEPLARRRFLTLSYGERRLALLARALAARPGLLLLDELLNGLDSANRMRALGWTPKIKLRDGIAQTYDWFLKNVAK